MCALHQDGTTRYNTLKRKIRGITNTMLASSLKELEEDGLICRTQYMEMPLRVEYALTDRCDDLMPILWPPGAVGRVRQAGMTAWKALKLRLRSTDHYSLLFY